jgi:serine/threonine-protein kinase
MDLPIAEREAWIESNVSDSKEKMLLRRLLAAAETDGVLDIPSAERAARIGIAAVESAEGLIGQSIGAFKLVSLLGQGGMATVFLGEREAADFRQQVAIKLLRRGLYSELEQRLFRRERQALAALSHPNIAHLIDGGITDAGVPYIVLEYVDGTSLIEHAVAQQLDLRERLRLFVVVCRAIAAAHRVLIVHRDIKPSNILVNGEGQVKLLDFGIAKLLGEPEDGATRTGMAAMTPAYAAPEQQTGGTISTATDVYSLGVLLHELLLGERPQTTDIGPKRLSARVAELTTDLWSLPLPRTALRSALRGDLDNIVLKALAFEPERRYASAAELADDIERHLGAQPVNAHPPSNWYRTRKFVQRHRGGVATTVAFLLAILAALALALWQTRIARGEAERANAMRDFIVEAFAEAKSLTPRDGPPNIVEVVDQAIETARTDTQMNPRVRIELLSKLGNVLRVQGSMPAALELLRGNFEQARAQLGDKDPITFVAADELIPSLYMNGDIGPARELIDRLLVLAPSNLQMLRNSARVATLEKDDVRALADGSRAIQIARDGGDDGELSTTLFEFGNMQLSTGDLPGAIATFEETLALRMHYYGPRHLNVAAVHTALSRAWRRSGDLDRAVRAVRTSLDIIRSILPPDHYRFGSEYNALTIALIAQREFTEARAAAAEALRINRGAYGDDHPLTIGALGWVGRIEILLEQEALAIDPLREALRLSIARVGADHPDSASIRAYLGTALVGHGEREEGLGQLQQAIDVFASAKRPDPARHALAIENMIRIQLEAGDAQAAFESIDRLDALLLKVRDSDGYWVGRAMALRARAEQKSGRAQEASKAFGAADFQLSKIVRRDPLLQSEIAIGRAEVARELGDAQSSDTLAMQAHERFEALRQPPRALIERVARLSP